MIDIKKFNYPSTPKSTCLYYYTSCDWCSKIYRVAWWRLLTPVIVECPHCHNLTELRRDVRVYSKPIKKGLHNVSRES